MISKVQALAIEAAANAQISCFWSSEGLDYRLLPLPSDDGSMATLDVRDITGKMMTFEVYAVWVESDNLHISTGSGFKIVLITEDGEGE